MADTITSSLAALTSLASGDLFFIVDVSDTSMAGTGTSKKATAANVVTSLISLGLQASLTAGTDYLTATALAAAYQAKDADLTAIAALTTTSFGRSLLTQADAAAARTTLGAGTSSFDGAFASLTSKPTTLSGYGITDAQGIDSDLTAIAALSTTSFGRSLLTQADAAAARTTLGVGSGSGDVTAGSNFAADNRLVRSDGTSKGVQGSGITVDDSDNVSGVAALTVTGAATAATFVLGATTVTATGAELNYVSGVTSAIQTQLGTKYGSGGTDVAVTDGGTGRSTSTTAYGLIAAGTTATGAHQTLAAGATTEVLVGGGASALPVWTTATGTGAPVRAGSPDFTSPTIGSVAIPTISSTNTLTNKRVTPRVTTITSSGTPTVNTDNCDAVTITALAAAITSMTTNLSGTPTNFDQLEFRIKDDGTARAITWGASFATGTGTLPTTTTLSKVLHVWFEYDTVQSKWICMSAGSEP